MITDNWINVKDKLPGVYEDVVWLFENGYIFMDSLKELSIDRIEQFLKGDGETGRIVYWANPVYPIGFEAKE